jgi:uncharacterized RDD family membrane protein YckC
MHDGRGEVEPPNPLMGELNFVEAHICASRLITPCPVRDANMRLYKIFNILPKQYLLTMKTIRFLLFNVITRGYLKRTTRINPFGKRMTSMTSDMMYVMSLFIIPLLIIAIPLVVIIVFTKGDIDNVLFDGKFNIGVVIFSITLFVILNKDYYRGRSVAKRVLGYQIRDVKTNEIASPTQCVVRNITCFMWPVEAVFILINPSRRLGDFIAGTIVLEGVTESPESILDDINNPASYYSRTNK